MRIGVLGTGVVGRTIGAKLVQTGHEVRLGSRTRDNERAVAWAAEAGGRASHGTFQDAAEFGEVVFNCTAGVASLAALEEAGPESLDGKILIDVANPLDFSRGMPPSLTVCNTDSLGEQIQRAFPDARVVKTLNTVNASVMVQPSVVPGDHNLFVSGNDPEAKAQVVEWLEDWFGWKRGNIVDLGDIATARGAEMLLLIWVQLMMVIGNPRFNFQIVRSPA